MFVSVYLSNDEIQVACGTTSGKKINVKDIYTATAPEGCLIGGVIIDQAELAACLERLWSENKIPRKNVNVVIGSSQWIMRNMTLPNANKKSLMQMITQELSDDERMSDPVHDYMIMDTQKGDKTLSIMAAKAEKSFINGFFEVFRSIGVKVASIDASRNCQIKLLLKLPYLDNKTAIVLYIDGNAVSSVMWVNGQFAYSGRSRIVNSPDSEDFPYEIARNASNIVQFQNAQLRENPIDEVYVCGVNDDVRRLCYDAMTSFGLKPGELKADSVINMPDRSSRPFYDYLAVLGSAIKLKKNVNFYSVVSKKPLLSEKQNRVLRYAAPVILIFTACMIATAVMLNSNSNKQAEFNTLTMENSNVDLQQTSSDLDLLNAQTATISGKSKAADSAITAIESHPKLTTYVLNIIKTSGSHMSEINVTGFTADSGAVSISAKAKEANDISTFVDNLQDTGIFIAVEYSGYSLESDSKLYSISMTATLAPAVG